MGDINLEKLAQAAEKLTAHAAKPKRRRKAPRRNAALKTLAPARPEFKPILRRLKAEAEAGVWARGHKLGRWFQLSPRSMESTCKLCGRGVVINARPSPNDIDIGGSACGLNCHMASGGKHKSPRRIKAAKKAARTRARACATKLEWGFKRVYLGVDGFKHLFKLIGATTKPRKTAPETYHWRGRGVTIITNDNPFTGEFGGELRADHVGYAHYVGVTGKPAAVQRVVRFVRSRIHDVEESEGTRGYI